MAVDNITAAIVSRIYPRNPRTTLDLYPIPTSLKLADFPWTQAN